MRVATLHKILAIICLVVFAVGILINQYLVEKNWSMYDRGSYKQFNYELTVGAEVFIVGLLIIIGMIGAANLIMRKKKIIKTSNIPISAYWGYVFYVTVGLVVFDVTFGSWLPVCGGGFTSGNCVLLDGLDEIAYIGIVPAFALIGTVLILIGKKRITRNV